MIRQPVVAGSFYPGESRILKRELEEYIRFADTKKKVIGLISPHAGYVYSAGCAGKGFGQVEVPGTVIILGVNHQGFGHPFAVDGHDQWSTPLGDAQIHHELREKLVADSKIFALDTMASAREHSSEVQVPFIQYINPQAKIIPITISSHDIDLLIAGGEEIARLIKDNPDTLIVASSDMSHYIDAQTAKEKDNKAIDKILCSGCTLCIDACPHKAVAFDRDKGVAQKCNLCHHRVDNGLIPACADNICLAHCIHFVEHL